MYAAIGVAVLVVLLMSVGVFAYLKLDSNIKEEDAFEKIVGERPEVIDVEGDGRPLNVLVIGSDTREGQKMVIGSTPGLSDTTILLHLSADRKRAYAINIPRDLMVDRPECRAKDDPDTILPASSPAMWNAAYTLGGVPCIVSQFEHMTGIRLDHFMLLKFQAVGNMADALGGVPVCVPKRVISTGSNVNLPAGEYEVEGNRAIEYVRNRLDVGNGSDIGRMKRQQQFLAAMVKKAVSLGTLVNPTRAYRFLDAATRSVTTDPDMANLSELGRLGLEVRSIGLDNVTFATMPFTSYAPDPNRLAPGENADELWAQLRRDKPVDPELLEDPTTALEGRVGRQGEAVGTPGRDLNDDYGLCS
jgi:LCP family protein required for cell wall assembly